MVPRGCRHNIRTAPKPLYNLVFRRYQRLQELTMNTSAYPATNPPAAITGETAARLQKMMSRPQVETWKPEPGEQLAGVIVGSRMSLNPFGQSQQQAIVQTPEGRTVAVWLSAWMLAQFQDKRAEKGDLVVISYLGKKQSNRGTTYGQYSIEIEKVAA